LLVAGRSGTYPDVSLSSAEIYDPVSGTCRTTTSLITVRHQHSATLLLDGRVLVIGGYNPSQGWLSSAEIYDPATEQWRITQPIFAHGVTHTATLLKDGRVLVMAGAIQSGSGGPDDRVEIFDPKTNRWQQAALHENTESNHTATLLPDGRVLIAGGSADPAIYDPTSDTWQPAGSLAVDRAFTRAVLLQDGRVLLIGGLAPPQGVTALNSVEIYDPASNTWRQSAPLSQARFDHTATLLPDGRVLVTGGTRIWDAWDDPGALLSSVEIYDPVSDTWSDLSSLQQARTEHTATLLPDGRVLVTGGRANQHSVLDSVEILKLEGR
jgi:N-acetylneuraminic acid mutarotase